MVTCSLSGPTKCHPPATELSLVQREEPRSQEIDRDVFPHESVSKRPLGIDHRIPSARKQVDTLARFNVAPLGSARPFYISWVFYS